MPANPQNKPVRDTVREEDFHGRVQGINLH